MNITIRIISEKEETETIKAMVSKVRKEIRHLNSADNAKLAVTYLYLHLSKLA